MVQGITGSEGRKHTALMLKAGTKIVAGVNSRKAGTSVNHGDVQIPVYATVSAAMHKTGAIASAVFVPPAFAKDAVIEAIEAGIELLVTPTISRGSRDSGTGHQDDRRSHRRMWSRVVP
jgi:succinyl-CoA synthetase alpha subunit